MRSPPRHGRVCQQCGGHFDTTTVIGRQDTVEPVVEPGPRTAGEAAALRATLGRIVQLMLEVIGGRRPSGSSPRSWSRRCCAPARHPVHQPGGAGVGAGVRARRAGCRTRRRHRLRAPDPRVRRPVRAGRRRVAVRRVPDPLTDNRPGRRPRPTRAPPGVSTARTGGVDGASDEPAGRGTMPSMPTPTPTPPPPAQPGRDGDPRTAQRAQPSTQLQVGPGVRPDAGPDSGSGAAVAAVSRWQTEVQQTWAERPSSSLLARGCGPACPPESAGGRSPVRAVDLLEYAAQLKDVFRRKASSNVPAPPRGPACRRLPYFPVV